MYNEETDNFAKLLDSCEQSKSFAETSLAEDYYNYVSSTYLYGAIGEDRRVLRIHPGDIEYSRRFNIPTTDAAVGVAKLLGMFYDETNKLEETIEMTTDKKHSLALTGHKQTDAMMLDVLYAMSGEEQIKKGDTPKMDEKIYSTKQVTNLVGRIVAEVYMNIENRFQEHKEEADEKLRKMNNRVQMIESGYKQELEYQRKQMYADFEKLEEILVTLKDM